MSKRNSQGSLSKGSYQNVPETLLKRDPEDKDKKVGGTADDDEISKKPKLAFGLGKIAKPPIKLGIHGPIKKGIQIKLGAQKPAQQNPPVLAKSHAVAAAFNDDDEDEPEEMPPEARMRMRNIGRETPTSAGPNSFGKTKQGFCDNKKMFEKTMKRAMDGSTSTVPPEDSGRVVK